MISTSVIIALGLAMVAPTFIRPSRQQDRLRVMLSFSVIDFGNVSVWCNDLSSFLKADISKASVFFTGKLVERHPECVGMFGDEVDIGSQTYNYVDLASIPDFTLQLEEVRSGKYAVDHAGNLDAKLFRAPYGSTDENIYSLLSQSGIVADFSYEQQYNIFQNGQFIRFDAKAYEGAEYSADFFLSLPRTPEPVFLTFNNTTPISQISRLLSRLKNGNFQFINASEVAGLNLTERR